MKISAFPKGCCAAAKRHGYRSAEACPPRSLRRNEKRPQPGSHGRLLSRSLHGEGQALALRWEEGLLGAVARGPVPRDAKCLKQDSHDLHDLQDYLTRNEPSFCNGCLFRAFRTYMSIEKQTCHCFQGPLGPSSSGSEMSSCIKEGALRYRML